MIPTAKFEINERVQALAAKEFRTAVWGPFWPKVIEMAFPLLLGIISSVLILMPLELPLMRRTVVIIGSTIAISWLWQSVMPSLMNKVRARRGFEFSVPAVFSEEISVSDGGLLIESHENHRKTIFWVVFNQIITSDNYIFFVHTGDAVYIPRASFAGKDEEKTFIEAAKIRIKKAKLDNEKKS